MENKHYFGCRIRQRTDAETLHFFVFTARVKDVKMWAGIRRIAEMPNGTQRVLRKTRSNAITRFLRASSSNTIPSSILIAFGPQQATYTPLSGIEEKLGEAGIDNNCDEQLSWGEIRFSFDPDEAEHQKPALIVDGQHRVFGMAGYEPEDMPILIVTLLDAPPVEQAFQFIVINDKAVHVPKTDAKSILASFDQGTDENLRSRLLAAGVSYKDESPLLKEFNDLPESPFHDLLDWAYNREGPRIVPLTAIEQSVRFMRTYFSILETDDDSLVEIFSAMWRAVKSTYSELWPDNLKLLAKVNINAVTEFLAQRLKLAWEFGLLVDIFDTDAVEERTRTLLEPIPRIFWEVEWSVPIQDNSNVRDLIKEDLETLAGNFKTSRTWTADLKLPIVEG